MFIIIGNKIYNVFVVCYSGSPCTANISWTHDVGGGDETITYTVKTGPGTTTYANSTTNITTSGTTTGTITGLSENNTNRIWVVATNSAGSAAEFGPVSFETRMAPPASISFSSVTTTSMTVNWANSAIGDLEDGDETQVRFGTNSNHASNTLYIVNNDDFSKSFSGLTAGTQHYVSVAGFSEFGIVGDAATDNQQTLVNTVWGSQGNFTITRNIGTGAHAGTTDTVSITNPSGVTSIGLTDVNVPGTQYGDLEVRASYDSMPPVNANQFPVGEVHTAYISTGNSANLPDPSVGTGTLHMRFRFTPNNNAGQDIIRVTLTNNSQTRTFDVTIVSHNPAKSDRRLKTDIKFIKNSPSGIPIHQFRFKDNLDVKRQGVIAQDLLKMGYDDVVYIEDGYYHVNYDKIDVEPIEIVDN